MKELISDELFHKFSDIFYEKSGIKLGLHKKYLLINRLSKYIGRDKEFSDFPDYYKRLLHDSSGDITTHFVNTLTTNFSFFFREQIHFEFLKHYLQNKIDGNPYTRIWSAGCSTGEEPYSIMMTAMDTLPGLEKLDLKVLASDISTKVINTAVAGEYNLQKTGELLTPHQLRTYFDRHGGNQVVVKKELKNYIAFRYLNLLKEYPFKKKFDIVFLRNVLIYFDNYQKEIIVNKVYEYVKDGGYFIIGLGESLVGIQCPYRTMRHSIYKKV